MKELGVPNEARCTSGAFEGGDFWFLDDYTIAHGIIARTDLRALGLKVIAIDPEEILKAGGGPHCMTCPLLRE